VAGVLKVLMATHSQTSRAIRKGGGRGRAFTGSFLTLPYILGRFGCSATLPVTSAAGGGSAAAARPRLPPLR